MWRYDTNVVPYLRTDLPGPIAREFLERDERFVSPSYTRMYPLVVDHGSGAVIADVDGNLFLDFTAGIAVTNVGHCHPEVTAVIQAQAAKLVHMSGTDFYYAPQIDLAEALALQAPGPSPKRVFFTNSGAEAIEAALKLSRRHTGRSRVIAFLGAFHGRTYGAMSLSASKLVHRRGFGPLLPDIHHVPYPRSCDGCSSTGCRCLREMETTLLARVAPPDEIAAIFVEVIQGEGGYYVAPPGFLENLRDLCDRYGILLVVDEVQSGMGRTGRLFACEHFGIEPDILCTAKGIANGLPLGAIIAKAEVMDWPSGSHATTFGGNPVSCAAALKVLELLDREYIDNARRRGEQLRYELRRTADRFGGLGNVRGLGLMTAVDVLDEQGRPNPERRNGLIDRAFERGLLLLPCGEAALRFCPPLCVTAEQISCGVSIVESLLEPQWVGSIQGK